jgi:hypothetical protein
MTEGAEEAAARMIVAIEQAVQSEALGVIMLLLDNVTGKLMMLTMNCDIDSARAALHTSAQFMRSDDPPVTH